MFHIYKRSLCLVILFVICNFSLGAQEYISVKQYGAKSDGVSDDAEAIQKVINASQQSAVSTNKIKGTYELTGTSIYIGGQKTVFFPFGYVQNLNS